MTKFSKMGFALLFFLGLHSTRAWSATDRSTDLYETGLETLDGLIENDSDPGSSRIENWDQFFAQISGSSSVQWGVSFEGRTPLNKNADTLMHPASTQKTVTAIAALHVLGGDFRFQNSFQGKLEMGTGELTDPEISVSGDPTWALDDYSGEQGIFTRINRAMIELKKLGVKKVSGTIQVTNLAPRLSEVTRPGPEGWRSGGKDSWEFEKYAVLPSPITLNGNVATFKITGYKTAAWVTPGLDIPILVNLSPKGKAFARSTVFDSQGRTVGFQLSGRYPGKISFTVPVYGTEGWIRNLFVLALKKNGILYQEKAPAQKTILSLVGNRTVFVDLSSAPLREIIVKFIQNSINIVGDRLFLEIAYRLNLRHGSDAVFQVLSQLVRDPALIKGVKIQDGCGLRLDNRLRPRLLMVLLDAVKKESYFEDFFASLAQAGESGTLRGRDILGQNAHTKSKIFGKTGSIKGVRNLVGYFRKPDQLLQSFAILTSTATGEGTQITPMVDSVLVEFARQNSGLRTFARPVVAAYRSKVAVTQNAPSKMRLSQQ